MLTNPRVWGMCACAALVLLCTSACGDAHAARPDALTLDQTVEFRVEIDGAVIGTFKSVEGLSIEQEVIEYQNGDDPLVRKRPGRVKYGDITLKRGFIVKSMLNDWIEEARRGTSTRKDMTIVLNDNSGTTAVRTWNCFQCFPKSWKMSSLDGKGNDIVTEEMVIVIEWFEEA